MKRILFALVVVSGVIGLRAQQAPPRAQLVIVVDGLRPDYITPDVMPRLYRLGQRGIVFNAHHSVFPTVTRVNASSLATGAYAETHGLMGNNIYIPKANATKGLDTGDRANLESVERAEGTLLTAPTLSEILKPAGKTLLVVSSGSSGSAYLLNHTVATGGIVHYDFALPPALAAHAADVLGAPPAAAMPNDPRNQYAIDAYVKLGLDGVRPDVTFMWLNDPDGTAHAKGIGSELAIKSLVEVDAGIGRIEDTLRAKGLLDQTNILVISDHGFSTHTGRLRLASLVAPFARDLPDGSKDIVVSEGAIYLRSGDDSARLQSIVTALQKRPEVGAIFTRPAARSATSGVIAGTLSFDVARWNHPRAGQILVSANWSAEKNAAGWPGTSDDGGIAGHGTSSPYDIRSTLIAVGPDFREHAVSGAPTANVDVAPTLLRLVGVKPPESMSGRVIEEGLRSGPSPASMRIDHVNETVKTSDESYQLTAHFSIVAGKRYLDSTEVIRR